VFSGWAGVRKFGDLRINDPGSSLSPDRQYKLVVMASDVSRGRLAKLPWGYRDYRVDPDEQLVADAIRASMSIPFFYEPVRMKTKDAQGKDITAWMVDGGHAVELSGGGLRPQGREATSVADLRDEAVGQAELRHETPFEIRGALDFAKALIGTMTNFYDQIHIEDEGIVVRTMFVDTTGVKATDFDLDQPTQDLLYENGRDAAPGFLATWDFEAYKEKYRKPRE